MLKGNKYKITALLIVMAMLATCVLTGCGEKKTMSMGNDVSAFVDNIDMDYAYDVTSDLAYNKDLFSNEHGFRNAGSDAEQKTADYLMEMMEDLGLEEVEKIPFTVDKWQFNGATLEMNGVDKMEPVSYASYGTDADGITAEVVDVGDGTAANYEGKDVTGKIVVAGIDQWNNYWINLPLEEANLHGAAAIVTYATGGYSQVSDDAINIQDICTKPSIPCVSVSKNQGEALIKAAEKDGATATLIVDNELLLDEGTSYNVVGKIKGKSDAQQIIMSGHYDMYFNGFQDDCAAIGLILSVAKGMLDSDYKPENDILFVCHGAEEWGASGTEFDWATGSWEQINTARPEWAEKTIAVFNFELPAYEDAAEQAQIRCVPELRDMVKTYVADSGFAMEAEGDIYPKGTNEQSKDTGTYDDNISYRFAGIPTFTNLHNYGNGWYLDNYHTAWDNMKTYNEDLMKYNIGTYGSLAIMVDKTPALPLNFEQTYSDLKESLDEDAAKAAGVDVDAFNEALEGFKEAAVGYNKKIDEINSRYETAAADNDKAAMKEARADGQELNKTTLKIFKEIQDQLIWVYLSADVTQKHGIVQENVSTLSSMIDALDDGVLTNKDGTGALDLAASLNGGLECGFYDFSSDIVVEEMETYTESTNPGNLFWGSGKMPVLAETYEATLSLLSKDKGADFTSEKEIYSKALESQKAVYKQYVTEETDALKALTEMMK